MKKLIAIVTAVIATAFVLAPAPAEAGHSYKSKRIGSCGGCGKSIYAYYRPVTYRDGCTSYQWVPAYHNSCRSSHSHSHYRSYNSYRPSYRYESYRPSYRSGFSISIGRRNNYCR